VQTSNLALSAVRMSAKKVIVKQLEAILNLGGTTVLCCDKTGTLTQDCVVLHSAVDGAGEPYHIPLEFAYLNAHFQMGTRSFLDAAILAASSDTGGEALTALPQEWTKVSEIPFDSTRRMLSVVLAHAGSEKPGREGLMITKGAAEEVLERCTKILDLPPCDDDALSDSKTGPDDTSSLAPGAISTSQPIDEDIRNSLAFTAETLNSQGLRVIAVAIKHFIGLPSNRALEKDVEVVFEERDLVFVGFLAFLDPPKPDAAEAIERLKGLGVKVSLTVLCPACVHRLRLDFL
jgi:P-type Mg2+ transporter